VDIDEEHVAGIPNKTFDKSKLSYISGNVVHTNELLALEGNESIICEEEEDNDDDSNFGDHLIIKGHGI